MALLVYAMALVTFNETGLFQKACLELTQIIQSGGLVDERCDELAGELAALTGREENQVSGRTRSRLLLQNEDVLEILRRVEREIEELELSRYRPISSW